MPELIPYDRQAAVRSRVTSPPPSQAEKRLTSRTYFSIVPALRSSSVRVSENCQIASLVTVFRSIHNASTDEISPSLSDFTGGM